MPIGKTQVRLEGVNVGRMFERRLEIEVEQAAGHLESVSISGDFAKIELRTGKNKISIVRVPAEIAKTALKWDVLLRIEFRTEIRTDGFGQREKAERHFIRVVSHEEPLELAPGE